MRRNKTVVAILSTLLFTSTGQIFFLVSNIINLYYQPLTPYTRIQDTQEGV